MPQEGRLSSAPADSFVGHSMAAKQIVESIGRLASLDWTVLLTGESGVGKSLVASLIHETGPRHERAFVTVRCATLPRDMMEAELFGYEKGAFTGAQERRLGQLEAAHLGTLFLDEVADLPLALQPKLLHFLQNRTIRRLGGHESMEARVRVIAATSQDLQSLCRRNRFREDLYYRLNVVPVHIPPLRERPEDIAVVAARILGRLSRERGRAIRLTRDAADALLEYPWPGNARELDNVLQRATVFGAGSEIGIEDLALGHRDGPHARSLAGIPLRELERMAIHQTLEACRGNMAEAARRLGISKKGIYMKVKRLGLCPSATPTTSPGS